MMKSSKNTDTLYPTEFVNYTTDEVEKHEYILELIKTEPLFTHLKSQTGLRFLDLGCRVPTFLEMCYHMFNVEVLEGVELNTEEQCIRDFLDTATPSKENTGDYERALKCNNFFDLYLQMVKPDLDDGEPPLMSSLEEFRENIKIRFEVDIRDFLRLTDEKYDFVNATNVLHFLEDSDELDEVLFHISRILLPGGFVVIRLQSNWYRQTYLDFSRIKESLKRDFKVGISIDSYIDGMMHVSTFRNFLIKQ